MNDGIKMGLAFVALAILLVAALVLLNFTVTPIENKTVTGVFGGLSVDKNYVTLYFQNATVNNGLSLPQYSITYFQRSDNNLQVPLVIGHKYQCVFGIMFGATAPILQTVVEIPQ
jgi:hypothetical protein